MIPGSASPFFLGSSLATATAGGLQIERSLRFNSSDSAYLSKVFGTAGNRRTWTWSGWVKKVSNGNTLHGIFSARNIGTYDTLTFGYLNSDTLGLNFANSAGSVNDYGPVFETTQVFRDNSAWYHILVAVDTTQATASDRVKLYVNGSQVTTFSSTNYPAQNYQTNGFNNAETHYLGAGGGLYAGRYLSAYLTNIHFIDGQALTPSSFTETDATTGQLIPKTYTGSYGTNGFNLLFADNSSNTASTLGKDTSGLSNNWTPNNFSVVAGGPTTVTTPASNAPPTVDYLVVAGGGGGSRGGGGAGGLRSTVTATGGGGTLESPLAVNAGTQYTVTVGAGGAGDPAVNSTGTNGVNSVFSSITSTGGGGGAQATVSPLTGGSGGGAEQSGISGAAGTANQGFKGGDGFGSGGTRGSGGGGGAGAVGVNGASATGGAGGAGVACSITGSSVTYGGGGGSHGISTPGAGGTGGGGNGISSGTGASGSANTGGGGGGGGGTGGAGGSGIVIIRYANTYGDLTVGSGLTYTYANTGGYKIYSFTASATAAQAAGNDSLVDSPTNYGTDTGVGGSVRGNYCTWNPLGIAGPTPSNGNLDIASSSTAGNRIGTILLTSGKWYWECSGDGYAGAVTGVGGEGFAGSTSSSSSKSIGYWFGGGIYWDGGSNTSGIASYTTSDIIGIAVDMTAGTVAFYKNNSLQYTATFGSGTVPNLSTGVFPSFNTGNPGGSARSVIANFGQRAFAYTAPSGFKAL